MKVLAEDRQIGRIKLRPDSLDDLWHLSHLVGEGDLVHAKTQRREEERADMVRDKGSERVTVVLGVRVASIEFHEASGRLRLLGEIEDGPEDVPRGSHHTLSIDVHDWVEITKRGGWPHHLRQRVKEAVDSTDEPRVTIVAMDDDEGTVAVVHQFGVREIGTKRRAGGGKQYKTDDARAAFYHELREVLATTAPEQCPVIVVGPGFARENFVQYLKDHRVDRLGAIVTEPAGHPGMSGVQEALRRGAVRRVAERSRVAAETELVEEVMSRLGQDGAISYGPAEVEASLNAGAVEHLLVTDRLMREPEVERLLELARQTGAEVTVVGSGHEAGDRLTALTGIAALLRFKAT